jgi:23S rRNA (uracil1939-C5)-methyltransferase
MNTIIENITILDAGAKGVSIAKMEDGKVILVKNGVPGDVGKVMITKKRRKYIEGILVEINQPSPHRIEPKCVHFGVCGGCKWQHMRYEAQLMYKQKEVANNLKKIAHLISPETSPIIGSKKEYHYRNKMEFSFSSSRWLTQEEVNSDETIIDKNGLGLHIPGMWSKVLDLKECFLQENPSEEIRLAVKKYAQENNLNFYDLYNKKGFLRTLMIRTSSLSEVMVLFQLGENKPEEIKNLLEFVKNSFPHISSLLYTINSKENDTIYDLDIKTYFGKDFIVEEIEELRFKIGPKSFFQTNSHQAVELYKKVRGFLGEEKESLVYDLYSGTGTIAQFIAKNAKKVVGVESVLEAVEDAKKSAAENNIQNVSFFCGDMKEMLNKEFTDQNGLPDIIITDPPRDGMHPKVVENILTIAPKKIIYVSCNSATQARDLALMQEKYEVLAIQPVDMFPQTYHVENIVVLEKKVCPSIE